MMMTLLNMFRIESNRALISPTTIEIAISCVAVNMRARGGCVKLGILVGCLDSPLTRSCNLFVACQVICKLRPDILFRCLVNTCLLRNLRGGVNNISLQTSFRFKHVPAYRTKCY